MAAESLLPVVELLPGPAFVVGPDGEILGANDRAGYWIGPGRGPIVGRPLARLVADPPERVTGLLEACAHGRKTAGSLTPIRAGGAGGECRVEAIAVPGRPDSGEPNLVVVHVIPGEPDGGGGDRADAGGPGARDALREEVRRNDEFLDRLAHDLRNPVAALSSALHLARRATAPADVAWAEDTMERQLGDLVRQLDDLQDLSRINRGRIELKRQRLDAAAAARTAAAAARPMIEGRDHQLTLSTSPGELAIDADPARLEQILVGLLGHVAGTTEPGGRIRLAVARDRDAIVFRVGDQGKESAAMPPESPASATGHPSGWEPGIGLTLIRKLAEMHGGSASARGPQREPGGGREFTIRLPAAADPSASESMPANGAPPAPAATAGARILVVDDNVDAARGTARLLQLSGHDVQVAHDGRQALEIARDYQPRFILLDIGLPGMDGYEVARQLRCDPHHRAAIIIAISGYSMDDYREPRAAGFDHHLVKPLDYEALRAILARHTAGPM